MSLVIATVLFTILPVLIFIVCPYFHCFFVVVLDFPLLCTVELNLWAEMVSSVICCVKIIQ